MDHFPSLSTDQVAAFVQLSRQGSIRAAAEQLHITEQGVRNRLIALEKQLGVSLYRKRRGIHRAAPLTQEGQRFLSHAVAFLEQAQGLAELFSDAPAGREVRVAASQYLIAYVLIDAVHQFHKAHPDYQVRLSSYSEQEIERALLQSPQIDLGVAAPYEATSDLDYLHLFSMDWSLVTPRRHPLLDVKSLKLKHIAAHPLITYERGSTGRQHILEAFHKADLSPRVEVETTNTDLIIRMVEAGLGTAIVPLLPSGAVTKGRKVEIRPLGRQVRPIDSGILTRKSELPNEAAEHFIQFIRSQQA